MSSNAFATIEKCVWCCSVLILLAGHLPRSTCLFNVYVSEDVPATALATKHQLVHNQTFRRLFYELLSQVYHIFSGGTLGQLQLTHFRQIVVVLVSKHLTASKAFNWDNHLILNSSPSRLIYNSHRFRISILWRIDYQLERVRPGLRAVYLFLSLPPSTAELYAYFTSVNRDGWHRRRSGVPYRADSFLRAVGEIYCI